MREVNRKWVLRFITIPMLVLLFVLNAPGSAQAAQNEENYVTVDLSEYILQAGGLGGSSAQFMEDGEYRLEESWLSSETDALENVLCSGWEEWSSSIDVSAYRLSTSEFATLYWNVLNLHPEMFFVDGRISYTTQGGYVAYVYPYYVEEYTTAHVDAFNRKVDEIMAGVDGSWPDIEKILYLHDYMVTHIEYDETYSKYDAYNALIEGSCVCQGYSLAYICLLNQIDVNVDYIVSRDLNHAWNLIELGGEYFYTDVTWDDPLGTSEDYCRHTNFMVDQQGLVDAGHDSTDWNAAKLNSDVYDTLTTSSKYMDAFWRSMHTAVPLVGTKAGYLSDAYAGKICIYDFNTESTSSYDRYTGQWMVWDYEGYWYTSDYCAMTSAGNAFYYTTPKDIYRMDLDGTSTKVYTLSAEEAALGYIYGLTSGETLLYSLSTEPYGDVTYVGSFSYEEEQYISADGFVYRLLDYDEESNKYTSIQIIGYQGTATDVIIPGNIDGYIVASIGDNAFSSCENVNSITVASSVTDISTTAFSGCDGLLLKGYLNSYVATYASNNGFAFEQVTCSEQEHALIKDDDDCTTAVVCSVCGVTLVQAKAHAFSEDYVYDDEAHWRSCQNNGCKVTENRENHVQAADDGDCTTAVLCKHCDYVFVIAINHNFWGWEPYDEEYHRIVCHNDGCQVVQDEDTHWAPYEDNDCTTSNFCIDCGYMVTEAKEHVLSAYFHNDDEEMHFRTCLNDNCHYIEENEHVPEEDDGDATTPVLCEFCDYVMVEAVEPVNPVEAFVTRMYQQCLSRDPDQSGLDGWVGQLENGIMNGAQIAEQFVFSNEMLEKNLSNEEFVNILYRAMMGREADEAGRTGWVNELNNGYLTRSEVTKAFVESTEFTNICSEYGITRGTYDASMAPIEHFVTRFYTLCLERNADQAGLYGWVNNLKNKYMNGAQIAEAFIFSDEFVGKNVSDEKYVELLYNTLLGRPSDANGKAGWVGELQGGYMTREGMMKAFIESTEFTGICEKYGITRGTVE